MNTKDIKDLDTILQVINDAVYTCKGKYLKDIEEKVLVGSLKGQTYEVIAEEHGYSHGYISKDVGYKLWQALTEALEESVTKNNLNSVIRRAVERSLFNSIDKKSRKKKRDKIPFFKTLETLVNKLLNYKKE